jgi:hypothetical protein
MQLDPGHQANLHQSYLVRFWQSEGTGVWRASAKNVQTGALVLFADTASLFAFLQAQIATDTTRPATDGRCATPPGKAG